MCVCNGTNLDHKSHLFLGSGYSIIAAKLGLYGWLMDELVGKSSALVYLMI